MNEWRGLDEEASCSVHIVAIAGGTTAIAASVGKNSVTSKSIKDGNVTAKDLAKITMVEVANVPIGGNTLATCPAGQRLIGGGGAAGGGGSLIVSAPGSQRGSERTAEAWDAAGGFPSRTIALCLSAKPSKQSD